MNGILSSAPSLGSIRLLLGSKLLLLVQSWLLLHCDGLLQGMLRFIVAAIVLIAVLCLLAAIIGESSQSAEEHRSAWHPAGGKRTS